MPPRAGRASLRARPRTSARARRGKARLPTPAAVAADIRAMRIRGAAAIAGAAADALARHVAASTGSPGAILVEARRAARRLDAARPTAISLHNALGWVLQGAAEAAAGGGSADDVRRAAQRAASAVAASLAASRQAIARHGAAHLRDGAVVLTHCNSTTAVAVLAESAAAGKTVQAIATETRPWRQGLVTVKALRAAGVPCALAVDSAVQHLLATRDVDAVLVGADTVARDGSLVNKIGTAGVAALARANEVPFLAAAGLHKFSRMAAADVPIEERPAAEVARPSELPRGVRVLNPVFDVTAPGLVDAYITEDGLASPRKAVQRNVPRLPPEEVWG